MRFYGFVLRLVVVIANLSFVSNVISNCIHNVTKPTRKVSKSIGEVKEKNKIWSVNASITWRKEKGNMKLEHVYKIVVVSIKNKNDFLQSVFDVHETVSIGW